MLKTEQHALDNVLSEWRSWGQPWASAPELLHGFRSGLTNRSYLIRAGQRFYKLRMNAAQSALLGINRQQEQSIVQRLAPLNLTPKLLYSAPDYRYSLFEYIDGDTWTQDSIKKPENLEKVSALIARYQSVPFEEGRDHVSRRNYLHYFQRYENQLEKSDLTQEQWQQFSRFKIALRSWQNKNTHPLLSHHDLLPENIVEHEKGLCILDWEYAAIGCGDLDYLSIGCKYAITDAFSETLFFWLNTLWFTLQSKYTTLD